MGRQDAQEPLAILQRLKRRAPSVTSDPLDRRSQRRRTQDMQKAASPPTATGGLLLDAPWKEPSP